MRDKQRPNKLGKLFSGGSPSDGTPQAKRMLASEELIAERRAEVAQEDADERQWLRERSRNPR